MDVVGTASTQHILGEIPNPPHRGEIFDIADIEGSTGSLLRRVDLYVLGLVASAGHNVS